MRPLGALTFGLIPLAAVAEEAVRPALKSALPVDLWQWTLAMALVLGAIALTAWFMRRMGNFTQLPPGKFKVLAALSVGARERVVLLQAGDKQLVLGVAPGRVQTLCVLEGQDLIRTEQAAPLWEGGPTFAERMAELMGKRQP